MKCREITGANAETVARVLLDEVKIRDGVSKVIRLLLTAVEQERTTVGRCVTRNALADLQIAVGQFCRKAVL